MRVEMTTRVARRQLRVKLIRCLRAGALLDADQARSVGRRCKRLMGKTQAATVSRRTGCIGGRGKFWGLRECRSDRLRADPKTGAFGYQCPDGSTVALC